MRRNLSNEIQTRWNNRHKGLVKCQNDDGTPVPWIPENGLRTIPAGFYDHIDWWEKDGRIVAVTVQPYDSDGFSIIDLYNLLAWCTSNNLFMEISSGWHNPGHTIAFTIYPQNLQ